MLPVLPRLAGLAGNAVAGGANAVARGAVAGGKAIGRSVANAGRTATRRINTSITNAINNANAGGGNNNANAGIDTNSLQEATQLLQQVVDKLKEATTQTQNLQTESSKLSKIWHGMGNILNKVLVTPLKKALGFLGSMLRTARNLVMAMGALAVGTFFANTKGQIEKHRTAGLGGVDARQNKAYNRAKAMMGLSDSEFNLANLQSVIGSQEGYGILAQLGVNRDEIANLNGIDAMNKVNEAIWKQIQNIPQGGAVWDSLQQAVMKTTGIDINNAKNRELFNPKKMAEFQKEYGYFYKNLKDTKSLVEAQKAIARVQYKIKDLGESFSVWLAPYVTKIADTINQFMSDPESMKGFGEIMDKIFSAVGSGISKLKSVFTQDVLSQAIDTISQIGSALLDITSFLLPYFLEGLNVLGAILQDLANFLKDPQAWWDKTKGTLKEMRADDKINASIYGKKGRGWQNFIPVYYATKFFAPEHYDHLNTWDNEAMEKDINDSIKQSKQQAKEVKVRGEVVIKNENGVVLGISQVSGGGGF